MVGKPDADRGQIVKAFVVLRPGHEPTKALASDLQRHAKSVTAPYKYPREIEFVTELPKTRSGKIRRVDLRRVEEDRAAAVTQAAARGTPVEEPSQRAAEQELVELEERRRAKEAREQREAEELRRRRKLAFEQRRIAYGRRRRSARERPRSSVCRRRRRSARERPRSSAWPRSSCSPAGA